MSEIPQHIKAEVDRLWATYGDDPDGLLRGAVCGALLAAEQRGAERERERCAQDISNLWEMIRVRNEALEDWENGRVGP